VITRGRRKVVFAAAGLHAAAAYLEAAKGLPAYDRAGEATVEVKVAAHQLRLRSLDVHRAARTEAAGQGEVQSLARASAKRELPA
jgi:hypothetical protein